MARIFSLKWELIPNLETIEVPPILVLKVIDFLLA